MKTLNDYTQQAVSAIHKFHGAFYAFSKNQFDEQKQYGVIYVNLQSGLFCPIDNAKAFLKELEEAIDQGIAKDLEENGREEVINRELINYETYYTGDPTDAIEHLKQYGITEAEVLKIFNANPSLAF